MARGGARVGKPATPYANRTDLPGKVLPITAAPGQQYGAAGAQMAAQRVVPMASPPSPGAPAGGGPPQAGPPPVPPGGLGHIARPSERPAEHVMTGVASGPGAGPEAIPGYQPQQANQAPKVSDMLDQVAQRSGMQAIGQLASQARALGQ